jgi:hypothetical protein
MSPSSSYIVIWGQFDAHILGNHHGPTMHGGMQPPAKGGPGWWWWGYERTPDAATPGLAPLATDFAWSVVEWAWATVMSVFCPIWMFGWAFACLLSVESALHFLLGVFWYVFTCIQICDLQNMISRVQVELG